MPRRIGVAIGLAVVSLALAVASAQDQPQTPFRAGVTLINVDVYPRRDGRVIEGLTAADFEVFEDGAPQKIDAFEFIRSQPIAADVERRDPRSSREADELAADPHNRVFVVYFDIFHSTFEGAHMTRGPVLEFLRRTIGPTDLFGVMTPETPPERLTFARQLTTLEGELSNTFEWGLRNRLSSPLGRTPMEERLQTCMSGRATRLGDGLVALYREDLMMTNLERLMTRLSALREGRKSLLFMSEGWTPQPPATFIAQTRQGSIPRVGQGPGGTMIMNPRQMTTGEDVSWCDGQSAHLGSIDFAQRFRDLLTAAARANVSFYTVNVGGLQTSMPGVRMRPALSICRATDNECVENDRRIEEMLSRMDAPSVTTLRVLSENTDGMAIFNTNDLGAGFARIADDLSAYYLLGYASTNTKADGKFRRIEVRLKQPNATVTARKGYLAASPETVAANAAAAAAAAVPAPAAAELGRLSRLRPGAELFSYGIVREGRMHLVVEIAGAEMARGRWATGADVQATVAGPAGELTGSGRIDAGARAAIVEIALPDGAAGPWRTTLRVSSGAAELSDRTEIAGTGSDGSPMLGAPLLFRGTPSPRIPLRPVADFQFRRNERLRVEWPVTAALDARTARLLDRRGSPLPLPASATEVDTPAGRIVAVDLNLAPLAEGDYLIELSATKAGRSEGGLMAFRVVR